MPAAVDSPGGHQHSIVQRTREALQRLEDAIGGRDALVDAFVAAPPDESRDRLLGLLADPRNDNRSLHTIIGELDITGGEVLALYRSAVTAKAQVLAIHEVAQQLPHVSRDVMRRAQNHTKFCPDCRGTGQVWRTVPDTSTRAQQACEGCNGTGDILSDASLDHQKLALDLAGLVSKGSAPLVQIDNSSRTIQVGALPFAQLQKAVQKVLDPPALPAHATRPAATPIDRIEVSPPVEAVLVERSPHAPGDGV